jgi:peptidoglycan/LPS O-acetylase OafA/YrhL
MAGILVMIGYLIYIVGWIWMIVTAIQTGKDTSEKAIWAVVNFICGILGGIIFFVVRKQGKMPLMVEVLGVILIIVAVVLGGGQAGFNLGTPVAP